MHLDEPLASEVAEVLLKLPMIQDVLVRQQVVNGGCAKGTDGGQELLFRLADSIPSLAQKNGIARPVESRRRSRVGFQLGTWSTMSGLGRATARDAVQPPYLCDRFGRQLPFL